MNADEFEDWAATAMAAFMDASVEDEPSILFAVDEAKTFLGQPVNEGLIVVSFSNDDFFEVGQQTANQLLLDGPPRKVAAMATRLLWSPNDNEPTTDAWLATVVAPGHTAVFGVKRWIEDQLWHRLHPEDAPWLILSCASGLRAALVDAKPLVWKAAQDDRLTNRVDQEPPPTDEHGRI